MSFDVTLKQIAEALDVSTMTVSRALNNRENVSEETRKKVLGKARTMGYIPNELAKSLVSRKTNTIGVVIPKITHAFFPEVVRGIEEVTKTHNYQLFLTNSDEQFTLEKEAVNTLQAKRVDGILVSTSITNQDHSFYDDILKSGTKLVFFDRYIDSFEVSRVSVNDYESSRQITEHLINVHEYDKIGYLQGPENVSIAEQRYKGYREALAAHDIPVNDSWIIPGGFQETDGYQAMHKILELSEQRRPQAILAVNDPSAIGAMKALKEAGLLIPEDIALVGFTDDIRASYLEVPLTTVQQPAYILGKRAAQKLIQTIEEENEPIENIEILTSLKIRKSCGCS